MEYSRKAAMTLALVLFAMAAVATAQNSEQQEFLDLHNAARRDVGVANVAWNDTVAAYAKSYADQRRGDCALTHSPMPPRPYGENIFKGFGSAIVSAADAMKSWMGEKKSYDYASNTCSLGNLIDCGHYTQIVWRSTTSIGCASVVCDNGAGVFITCNYSPPGNVVGQSPY